MTRPNIVLLCADQWRGDCLSVSGHPVVRTPHLDELAMRGTRFTRAYSALPTCVPARVSLMTGLSGQSHGRVGYQDGVPFEHDVTMPGEFRRNGYQTQAIGKMHVYPERARIGFDNVLLHDGYLDFTRQAGAPADTYDDYLPWLRERTGDPAADYTDTGLYCNSMEARPWNRAEELHPTSWVGTQAVQWLRRRDPTAPFFLYVSFHRPHPPYDPPGWAFDEYLNAPMPSLPVGDWWESLRRLHGDGLHTAYGGLFDERALRRARAGYYGHMTHIDLQVERVMRALSEHGLADNTVVAFVSDHGEMLGDHHLFRKGMPYEGSARVPLLLAGPGVPAGVVCDEVVELQDVMPTLLDCAGLDRPDGLDGASALGAARGGGALREFLHGQHALQGRSFQWLTDGHRKYVWISDVGAEQLFDLDADPQELHDLSGEPASARELGLWRGRLTECLRGRPEGFVDGSGLVAGRPVMTMLAGPGDGVRKDRGSDE